jgi:hypothetical protein
MLNRIKAGKLSLTFLISTQRKVLHEQVACYFKHKCVVNSMDLAFLSLELVRLLCFHLPRFAASSNDLPLIIGLIPLL